MRTVNIAFQADVNKSRVPWEETPIVFVLREVPANEDISNIARAISSTLGGMVVRSSRLFLDDPLTPKQCCKYNGGYSSYKWN